jgi:hypothetical protein
VRNKGYAGMLPGRVLELAYRLAVSDQPMVRRIRENLVVLINPVSSPDGRDKQVDWFYRYLKGKTDRDTLPRQSPPYWGKYVFVDINRDTHQQTQETTKAVHRMFHEWHPTVVHDLHEAVPLLMSWNGTGPYNPNIDPDPTSMKARTPLVCAISKDEVTAQSWERTATYLDKVADTKTVRSCPFP